jgi:hypothetical protein
MAERLKIFIFSWNTQSVDFTQTEPDFIPGIVAKIPSGTDIVVIALQEESSRGSIINETAPVSITTSLPGYRMVNYIDMMGWGVTTYKKLVREFKYEPRGLSMAVFVRCDLDLAIGVSSKSYTCPSLLQKLTRSKGAVTICLEIPGVGNVLFLNAHLPFDSASIKKDGDRTKALAWQTACFRYLYTRALEDHTPSHYFVVGDLNYRCGAGPPRGPVGAEINTEEIIRDLENGDFSKYLETDELKLLQKNSACTAEGEFTISLKEGVENQGPTFSPTAKKRKGRSGDQDVSEIYKFGSNLTRIPSWTDRILYAETGGGGPDAIECVEYDSFESGNMNQSDHSAVYANFEI